MSDNLPQFSATAAGIADTRDEVILVRITTKCFGCGYEVRSDGSRFAEARKARLKNLAGWVAIKPGSGASPERKSAFCPNCVKSYFPGVAKATGAVK